jgi:hypothetical protein
MDFDFVRYTDFSDDNWIPRAFDSQGCDRFGHRNARYGDSQVPLNEEFVSRPRGFSILSVSFSNRELESGSQGFWY